MKPGTNRFGHEFTGNQVLDHVAKAVYRALVARSEGDEAGVALPDNKHHRARIEAIRGALRAARVRVYFASDDGAADELFEREAESWPGSPS